MAKIAALMAAGMMALAAHGATAQDRARLDIPGEAACVTIAWDDDDPTQSARRYGLHDTCDHAVTAHWCTGDEPLLGERRLLTGPTS